MNPEASLRAGLHPSIVLSAYLEPLVRGRRVAILGDATIGLADELSQRGARLLHVYDPDAARVAEALARAAPGRPHQVAYAVLAGDLGVRDGAFDIVIVPDLSLFADPADAMRRARRLVPTSGVAVFVAPNAAAAGRSLLRGRHDAAAPTGGAPALGYYELFDLVSLQFAKVRMIGQAPFVGYTVADFAPDGEPEVSVDTSLLASSEEPEHFLAVASDRPVSLEAYAVIELPWHDVAEAASSVAVHTGRAAEKALLAEAEARVAALGVELDALREREVALAATARSAADRATGAAARVVELEAEVEGRSGRLRELDARAGDNHVRAERLQNQIRDMEEELVRQRDRATKLSKLLDDEKRARTKAELELGMVRGNPEIAGAKDRIDALSADLDAARARIVDLETEQAHTPRHAANDAHRTAPPPDEKLRTRLEELERAVNAALHEAADAAGQRDAAQDRAHKAEALLARAAVVEAQLAAERRDRADLDARAVAAEARAAEAARRLAETELGLAGAQLALAGAEHQATEGARRASEIAQRLAEVERGFAAAAAAVVTEHDTRINTQQARLAEQQVRLVEQAARLTEQQARLAAIEAELTTERSRVAEAERDRISAEDLGAATAEIAALEGALRERGHVVAALTRDLRDSERVGKELLGELEGLHAWITNGGALASAEADLPPPPPAAIPDDVRARLDALAAGAARAEADLQAAAWRIAQLERELTEARRDALAGGDPTPVQIELEQALAAARDEVATLRRALGSAAS